MLRSLVELGLMRGLKSVIMLAAVSVGMAVFCLFGSIVGIWGGTRSGVVARDEGGRQRLQSDPNGPPPSSSISIQAETKHRSRGRPPVIPVAKPTRGRQGSPKAKLAEQQTR
jgi:hypothetical protein